MVKQEGREDEAGRITLLSIGLQEGMGKMFLPRRRGDSKRRGRGEGGEEAFIDSLISKTGTVTAKTKLEKRKKKTSKKKTYNYIHNIT